jgi:glycosyltransferase involved in cell wall biosynthesis
MPKLSIGIPVFNGQGFLPELLDSLLAQTFRDFEILVCDNASTDRTSRICGEYRRRDSRIHIIRNHRNVGAISNYNRVFELSTAPLFKWAAHDDVHHATYLETCVRLLEQDQDAVLAHTGTAFIDETSRILPFERETGSFVDRSSGRRYWPDVPGIGDSPVAVDRFWQVLTRARWGSHMYGVIRREALQHTSLLPNFPGSDRVMLAELALLGRFRSASEPLFLKRLHASGSAALDQKTLRGFLSPDGRRYSRRLRQVRAYFGAPKGKPISITSKSACCLLVAAHALKVAVQSIGRTDPRLSPRGYGWRGPLGRALRHKRSDCSLRSAGPKRR